MTVAQTFIHIFFFSFSVAVLNPYIRQTASTLVIRKGNNTFQGWEVSTDSSPSLTPAELGNRCIGHGVTR